MQHPELHDRYRLVAIRNEMSMINVEVMHPFPDEMSFVGEEILFDWIWGVVTTRHENRILSDAAYDNKSQLIPETLIG